MRAWLLVMCLLWLSLGYSQTYTTTSSGNFFANGIWDLGNDPGTTIGPGETVIINHALTYNNDLEIEGGTLIINASGSLSRTGGSDLTVADGGQLFANGLLTVEDFLIEGVNSRVEINDSLHVFDGAGIEEGKFIVNGGAFFAGDGDDFTIEDADSVVINGNITIQNYGGGDPFTVEGETNFIIGPQGNMTLNDDALFEGDVNFISNGSITVNGDLDLEGDVSFTSNGDFLVDEDLFAEDNVSITLNGTSKINDDVLLEGDVSLTFGGNAYIADDLRTEDNVNVTVNSGVVLEIVDVLIHDGDVFTINGAVIAGGGGNTNESENDATINGNGLLQIDGDGMDNNGTIAGTLDVCGGDGSSNPVSGDPVSGGATICSSSGINFPITPAAPLPVDLLLFTAHLNESTEGELLWETASEWNNHYFTLERSADGVHFEFLADISGAGNSRVKRRYHFTDEKPLVGTSYYRLSQTDFDGTYEILGVQSIWRNPWQSDEVSLYPNPSEGSQLNLLLPTTRDESDLRIQVLDAVNRPQVFFKTIRQGDATSHIQLQFPTALPAGFYVLQLQAGEKTWSKKFVVR